MTAVKALRVLGYARRSTEEQPTSLAAQEAAVRAWATDVGHEVVDVAVETISGASEPEDRPVLSSVLDRLAVGEGDALVVTVSDRLARSQAVHRVDYYAAGQGWSLVILDSVDRMADPESQLLHGIRVSVSQYERALIGRRTLQALAYRRANGVRLGRPRSCPDDVLERVVQLRAGGARLVDIADALNADAVPTPGGGARWWPSHVSRLLATQDGQALTGQGA